MKYRKKWIQLDPVYAFEAYDMTTVMNVDINCDRFVHYKLIIQDKNYYLSYVKTVL